MSLELYQEITLTKNIPRYQLNQGDIATLIDFAPHPKGGERGCVLEIFDENGKSINVVTVPISAIKSLKARDIYGGTDPRGIPIYSAQDAARYLKIPATTIRSWTVGYEYKVINGKKEFKPVIDAKAKNPLKLTFINLIEIHVLRAIRQRNIDLAKVRTALDHLDEEFKISHPLARQEFYTDGVDLFVECYGELINASNNQQLHLKNALIAHLQRIEPDDTGLAIKLFPFTRKETKKSPRIVVIDPRIAFGRMVIAGTGIPTDIIAERFQAGDSQQQLARDYNCDIEKIEEAIRCASPQIAA